MKMQTVRSQKGFSLIELMIVVAIIGILATIAIPNFNRFQVKARQAEAKANLSALYTAEKAFYTEWNGYYSDFRDIGLNLEGNLRYGIGLAGAATTVMPANFNPSTSGGCAANSVFNNSAAGGGCACINSAGAAGQCTLSPGFAWAAVAAGGACTANGTAVPTQTTFVGSANGTVQAIGGTQIDKWTITDSRILCNNQPAL